MVPSSASTSSALVDCVEESMPSTRVTSTIKYATRTKVNLLLKNLDASPSVAGAGGRVAPCPGHANAFCWSAACSSRARSRAARPVDSTVIAVLAADESAQIQQPLDVERLEERVEEICDGCTVEVYDAGE